ncbi:MAG: hypothetical protein JWL73_1498 [Actinomycetia bacterium]|nr:hypothetical protein [Actinomycetes bacterium]
MTTMDDEGLETEEHSAGGLADWLRGMRSALRGEHDADVPCGGCTACCRSSQFVHIGPEETDALAAIPPALLFPAPQMPEGHVLMGYDWQGRCPMLTDAGCSIYEHRPRTCRTYDCRVFAASGVEIDDAGKEMIAARVRQWRFDDPSAADRRVQDALRSAVRYIREHGDLLPEGSEPVTATRLAVLAVEIVEAFLDPDWESQPLDVTAQAVRVTLGPRPPQPGSGAGQPPRDP